MPSSHIEDQAQSKFATALVGCGAVLWAALCLAPYLYAASDLIQWR